MKRDYCHRFWVGLIGISASNYRLSKSSTGKPPPPAIGGEKSEIPCIVVELDATRLSGNGR